MAFAHVWVLYRASDSEGAVKNEEIQQVICVIVMIPQELPYSSQSFPCTVGSPSVFPDKLNQFLCYLSTCAGFSKIIESKVHKY